MSSLHKNVKNLNEKKHVSFSEFSPSPPGVGIKTHKGPKPQEFYILPIHKVENPIPQMIKMLNLQFMSRT